MSGRMPVKVLHERPADDLGGFDVLSCCPVIEPRLDVDGQPNGGSRGVPGRKLPAGWPAAFENDLGAGSGSYQETALQFYARSSASLARNQAQGCGVASQLTSIGPQAPTGRSATCGFGNISALGANSSSASS